VSKNLGTGDLFGDLACSEVQAGRNALFKCRTSKACFSLNTGKQAVKQTLIEKFMQAAWS